MLLIVSLSGCVNNQMNNDKEALINATRGAVNMILTDQVVYQRAIATENNKVTHALAYSTLMKAGILQEFEKEIGDEYTIEETLSLSKLNKLCWMGNFLQFYKSNLPLRSDFNDTYKWIDAKEKVWKSKLDAAYGTTKIKDDCRV